MAYYAAVITLKQIIHRLLNSSEIFILPSSRKTIKFAYEKVISLQKVLKRLERRRNNNSKMVNSLREQIRVAAHKLEDAVEFHISDLLLSKPERLNNDGSYPWIFSLDLDEVLNQEIKYFIDMAKKVEDECSKHDVESSNSLQEEEDFDDDDDDSSRIDFGGMESEMVGFHREYADIIDDLLDGYGIFQGVAISGMAGIGKTAIAKEIYRDSDILDYFDCRLWVTIGPKFQLRKVMLSTLAQLDHDIDRIQKEANEKLSEHLHTSLENKRYLIVMDDVWNEKDWKELQNYLPFDNKGLILLTTRRQYIVDAINFPVEKIRLLNKEESWCLLREKVFGDKSCSFQLEKAGKKIAEKCDGLPLLIVTVADLLSQAEKTLEYWNKIAYGQDKSIFIAANDKISNILLRSYKYLPQYLKPLFLYMGVFPSKCKIRTQKLINMWTVEDLIESSSHAEGCLERLFSENLVLAHERKSFGQIKTSSLHSSFWHASIKQSWNENFLHVISSLVDSGREGIESQRRLCVLNNSLLGFKEVYSSIESVSSARSLICSGPYHQYPVSICSGLRLLKVLDALSLRFYKFPIEVLKLIHLRYLALTCNGKVPASISKLWNLEYLIVHRHLSIKFPGDWSYLPVEIWSLQKLRHLNVMGSCLPYLYDALLPELIKLSNMSVHNCTKEIFERLPKLKKLGIRIELATGTKPPELFSCFDHLSHLHRLESLKCVIVNPSSPSVQVVAPPTSTTNFPSGLRKLSLSGLGYPWECMKVIAKLPNLEVLKLRSYAFRGPKWIVQKDDFPALHFMLLEDIDLVHLKAHDLYFPLLRQLIISHCYKLKEIALSIRVLYRIRVVDSPLISSYLKKNYNLYWKVRVHSSLER